MYWLRVILASNRGTLMELGISPVLTADYILDFLVGLKVIKADMYLKEDQKNFEGASKSIIFKKVLAILMTAGEAIAYIISGQYGAFQTLSWVSIILIFT